MRSATWPMPASAGIEAIYGRYSPRQRTELGNLARRFGLVATGGSDYHGATKPDLRGGNRPGRPARSPTGCSTSSRPGGRRASRDRAARVTASVGHRGDPVEQVGQAPPP